MCALHEAAPDHRPSHTGAFANDCSSRACSGACKRLKTAALPSMPPEAGGAGLTRLPIKISDAFTTDILKPYRANAKYLKSAEITQFNDKSPGAGSEAQRTLVAGAGRFAIPESCYIDDTGHFNAVEFNICYNQLAYVLFGKCIEAGLMHRLRQEKVDVLSLAEFKRHQLPSMVIVSIESRYYKQLNSNDFTGELSINKISSVGAAWFFFTSIAFADSEGVKARGSVVLAFSPTFAPVRH